MGISSMLGVLPFLPKRHEGDRLLPVVISVMTFLTVVSLASAIALGQGLSAWSRGLDDRITVQITAADDAVRDRETDAALRLLQASPDVANAEVLARSEVLELVRPFLGRLPEGSDLPLPNLIAVTLNQSSLGETAGLAARLERVAPSAILDDHQVWLGQLLNLAAFLRTLLATSVLLVVLSTAAIVVFGCRAGLAAHRDSIDIMHAMGAKDGTIARAFERRYLVHGLKGGVYGSALAGLVLYGFSLALENLAGGLMTALFPGLPSPFWLFVMPVSIGLVAMVTARLTVLRGLQALV